MEVGYNNMTKPMLKIYCFVASLKPKFGTSKVCCLILSLRMSERAFRSLEKVAG